MNPGWSVRGGGGVSCWYTAQPRRRGECRQETASKGWEGLRVFGALSMDA